MSQLTSAIVLNLARPTCKAFLCATPKPVLDIRRGKLGRQPVPLMRRLIYGAIWKESEQLYTSARTYFVSKSALKSFGVTIIRLAVEWFSRFVSQIILVFDMK